MTLADDVRAHTDAIAALAAEADSDYLALSGELTAAKAAAATAGAEAAAQRARGDALQHELAVLRDPLHIDGWGVSQDRTAPEFWNVKSGATFDFDLGIASPANVKFSDAGIDLSITKLATPVSKKGPGGTTVRALWSNSWAYFKPEYNVRYGRLEIEATLPTSENAPQGMWPAFWSMAQGGAGAAEIDLMEAWYPPYSVAKPAYQGGTSTTTVHQQSPIKYKLGTTCEETTNGVTTDRRNDHDTWGTKHSWAWEKTPGLLRTFFDGRLVQTFSKDDPKCAALWAVGGNFENPFDFRVGIAAGNLSYWLKNPATTATEVPKTMRVHRVTYWPTV